MATTGGDLPLFSTLEDFRSYLEKKLPAATFVGFRFLQKKGKDIFLARAKLQGKSWRFVWYAGMSEPKAITSSMRKRIGRGKTV